MLAKGNLYFSLLSLGFLSLVAMMAAIHDRPAFIDGSHWFFMVLDTHNFHWDYQFYRIFDALLQLPAIVSLTVDPPQDDLSIPLGLLSFSYAFAPVFFATTAIAYLSKKKEYEVIRLLILALLSGWVLSHIYALNSPSFALITAWSIFIFIKTSEKFGRGAWAMFLLLWVSSNFVYELYILFIPLFMAFIILRRRTNFLTKEYRLLMFLFSISIAWYLLRIAWLSESSTIVATKSLLKVSPSLLTLALCPLGVLVLDRARAKRAAIWILLSLVIVISWCTFRIGFHLDLFDFYHFRIVPLGTSMVLMLISMGRSRPSFSATWGRKSICLLVVSLVSTCFLDLKATSLWNEANERLLNLSGSQKCSDLSDQQWNDNFSGTIFRGFVPFQSVILQSSYYPKFIAFRATREELKGGGLCDFLFTKRRIFLDWYRVDDWMIPLENLQRFHLEAIVSRE